MTVQRGWLVDQLPRVMAEDHFVRRFVGIFEEIADSTRQRIDDLEPYFDIGLAPPEMVRWMASWVGSAIDPDIPESRQRSLAVSAGPLLPWRGTRRGLTSLVAALTRSDVEVTDTGGVFRRGEVPDEPPRVSIKVSTAGDIDPQQLLEIVSDEIPANAVVNLRVGRRKITAEAAEEDLTQLVLDAVADEVQTEEVDSESAPQVEESGDDEPS